jgi:short-subunit dehydrogenase
MSLWKNKAVLITGGSSGLGLAIAKAFCRAGARVAIAARSTDKLEAAATELRKLGGEVLAVTADIQRQADVESMVARTIEAFGGLDVLVNNAGSSARGSVIDTSAEEFAALMDLNFTALVRCTRAAMPQLLRSHGSLVNIGSLAGKTAARYMGAYSATKFAVSAYSAQLRLELGPQGLHVLLVSPGPIARNEPRTYTDDKTKNIPESARKPGGGAKVKLIQPEWLAERIVRACERRTSELIVPGKARLVFAISQLSADWGDWIVRKMS